MPDTNVGSAYIEVEAKLKDGAGKELQKDVENIDGESPGKKLGDGLLDGLGGELGGKIGPLLAGLLSTATVAAVGKALLDVGQQFDDMTDNIIIGTGASGEALAGLEDVAKNLSTSLPVSFGDAGQIVADLNTRLGLTGGELETLASKVATLGTFGEQIDINTMTGAFTAFGVEANDVANHLDYLWGVSQSTGVGMNQLFSTLQTGAPQLTQLGFSVEQSANLIGLLDKNGLNASTAVSTMGRALVKLAEPGQSAQDAFNGVVQQMQDFIAAGDDAAALDLAGKVFGTRQAGAFVQAVKSGSLSLEALSDTALGAAGDIEGTMEATMSWPEKWDILKNKFQLAVEPMATLLFNGLGAALDVVTGAFDYLGQVFGPVLEPLKSAIQQAGAALAPIAQQMAPVLQQFGAAIAGLLGNILGVLANLIADALPYITSFLQWVAPYAATLLGWLATGIEFISSLFDSQSGTLANLGAVVEVVRTAFDNAATFISGVWSGLVEFFRGIPGKITGFFANIGTWFSAKFDEVKTAVTNKAREIAEFWRGIPGEIVGFFADIGSRIGEAFSHIKLPKLGIEGSWNPADWVADRSTFPKLKISWAASGGIVDGATLIGAGEAGREAIIPLENRSAMQPFAAAVSDDMQADGTFADMLAVLKQIRDKSTDIYMDSEKVGRALTPAVNRGIGNRAVMSSRGAAYAF